jgi:predicted MPP superfamily phosphohydrolase
VLRLRSDGRGRAYTKKRGLAESVLRLAYRGSWPARAWAFAPPSGRVRTVRHELPLLPPSAGASELRIAFASDLHLGPTTSSRTLDAAFEAIDACAPDVLMLGGDYVFLDATRSVVADLEARVREVRAKTKVAVMGNHDLWTHHPRIERALERAGVVVLVNDSIALEGAHRGIAIAGLDDAWTGAPDAARALERTRDAALVIGLAHSPEGALLLASRGVPLVLSGHTHGGQIALPGGRPIIVPGPLGRAYPWGLRSLGASKVFVSRGVGAVELPIRAFAPADIGAITLVRDQGSRRS